MASDEKSALQYANDSGFPLQIGLQHAVEAAGSQSSWQVRYVEHGWVHPVTGEKGFIDLVLHAFNARQFLVIEAKRKLDVDLVFMHSNGHVLNRRHAKLWVTEALGDKVQRHGWANCQVDPACPEANFCVVRGKGKNDQQAMLERIGAELVQATEALAEAERDFRLPSVPYLKTFTPVLVTTASLSLFEFDPATVDLSQGKVPSGSARQVPWLRFRKQLATRFTRLSAFDLVSGDDPSYSMENTVFIVHAPSFLDFLQVFEIAAQ